MGGGGGCHWKIVLWPKIRHNFLNLTDADLLFLGRSDWKLSNWF
jgi:hypothetical protein